MTSRSSSLSALYTRLSYQTSVAVTPASATYFQVSLVRFDGEHRTRSASMPWATRYRPAAPASARPRSDSGRSRSGIVSGGTALACRSRTRVRSINRSDGSAIWSGYDCASWCEQPSVAAGERRDRRRRGWAGPQVEEDLSRCRRPVQRNEMNAGRSPGKQTFAQLGRDLDADLANSGWLVLDGEQAVGDGLRE